MESSDDELPELTALREKKSVANFLAPVAHLLRWLANRFDKPETPSKPAQIHAPAVPQDLGDPKDVTKGAQSEIEARAKYGLTKEVDPFPEIPPALLNSAHIEDYMLQTAMVYPYQPERRKSAAYAMRVGPGLAFRDPGASRNEIPVRQLAPGQVFELPPNSITYVQTKELFQLPNYMAVRFNLHIDLVHKGLLLGTGPLVDPGFSGRLVVPLHNMTANTYYMAEGDEFIWVEFTKTSMMPAWLSRTGERGRPRPSATFENFPKNKVDVPIEDYFKRALRPHRSNPNGRQYDFPVNATPAVVIEANLNSAAALKDAQAARGTIRAIAWGSIIGGTIAVLALIYGSFQTTVSAIGVVHASTEKVRDLEVQVAKLREPVARLEVDRAKRDYCLVVGNTADAQRRRASALKALEIAQSEAAKIAEVLNQNTPDPSGATDTSVPPRIDCNS